MHGGHRCDVFIYFFLHALQLITFCVHVLDSKTPSCKSGLYEFCVKRYFAHLKTLSNFVESVLDQLGNALNVCY